MDWHALKQWLETTSGLDMDALHVHAGILGQIGVALIFRKSLRDPLPWLAVLVAIIGNEVYDLHYEVWPTRDAQIAESAKDVWNTMLMPTLLMLLARFKPSLFFTDRGQPG